MEGATWPARTVPTATVGMLAEDHLQRDDVAVHLVFKDEASYDIYAHYHRHLEFIDVGKAALGQNPRLR